MPGSLRHRADVSVVVVAHGTEPGLPESVRSLLASLDDAARGAHVGARGAHDAPHADAAGGLRGDHLGGELVLVVRDVAALPCAVRAADPRVRVVAAPGVAGGRARNVGVAAARGRYLLFTVPGVRVPAGWVAALVAPLRSGHADLVAGAVHPPGGAPATGPAAALLGLVADPPPRGVLPEASAGATRAVLEAVGFDEALGTARYPGAAEVFRRDVVGAGFRAHAVAGVPVEVPADPRAAGGRVLAARARGQGRTAAYVERHLRDRPPAAAAAGLRLLRDAAALAAARAGRAPLDRLLPARAAVARDLRSLALLRAPDRERPRSAAGDAPGGAGAPRAAEPRVLVARGAQPPTTLPELPAERPAEPPAEPPAPAAAGGVAPGDRGVVHQFWSPARTRAAAARGWGALPPTG
ncbi:hypothetical protein CHO01_09360 [Cellulomonas hominis]|uniref:Uncharacterized protein n=1 Tax=Cellulomonas hominis TaxID=156981 RepID=A0A511F9A2_9CELL|nr:glycosyltransferase [Cellulomonas hominis]MBB5471980.1 hypothetical protein [Cellulomonas hominis]GEL45820.1 hypothetical protein CHO01_09360 [Cellulomonas hominis]